MPVLFDGVLWLTHGQVTLVSADDHDLVSHAEATAGQANGLCGAAIAGHLHLVIGTDSGEVSFLVELLDSEPEADARAPGPDAPWEDIVEVSFRPETGAVALVSTEGETDDLELPVADYRVRFSARGMDAAAIDDTVPVGEPTRDRYALQLWPAPFAPDAVIRVSTRAAASWHSEAHLTEEQRAARD